MTPPAKRLAPMLAVVAALAGALTGCGGPSDLQNAADACEKANRQPVNTGDDGKSLTVSDSSVSASGPSEATARLVTKISACVLTELDAPESTMSKVGGTTSLMGRQSDSWDGYDVSWTYHPDNGLEIIVETN